MKKCNGIKPGSWREVRRLRALKLRELGWSQYQIAESLGVSQAAVCQWLARDGGTSDPWRDKPHSGVPPKLSAEKLQLLPDLLSHGAEAYGFCGEVWTCARVAAVIREEFGVEYSRSHISRLLKNLGWTPQVPIQRATQRDEKTIEQWRSERWPALKKKRIWKAGR